MKYLMLVCVDESFILPPAEEAQMPARTERWATDVDGRDVRVLGSRVQPVSAARTVRVRDGAVLVEEGPFAATTPQIAGFDVLECATPEEAVEVAAAHPVAPHGVLELRPFWQG
ncbi:hypothetical protein GCM10010168_45620 [Actinoplanes ianthinogenes]|uniref:YCII-related domain-containing protein n=1 Tax=Actinoplanes ianthinogenes TaxID=122358 RepID=A0ABM7LPJ8_9ACTN|nr:YciI family protein [Actinoplanes ianthinogenes]BCJ41140.1 hypothetical protein Aiant_17970 [Actinoplanes ianthinogenes]GGR22639.1 hypothetical protein GCM10010168_45620 [Actinoplanes ianthinogenes]